MQHAPPAPDAGSGPDLVLTRFRLCGCCYGCDLLVDVHNRGDEDAPGPFEVRVLEGPGADGSFSLGGAVFDAGVAAGARATAEGRAELWRPDAYTFVVDPEDVVTERDEQNNAVIAEDPVASCF